MKRSSSVGTALMLLFVFAAVTLGTSAAHADTATWSVATPVVYANGSVGSSHDDVLTSVSCNATSNCTAVGSVEMTNGSYQAFATTETNGVYIAGQVAQFGIGVQSASPYAKFQSVSCSTAANCSAVGDFATVTGGYEAFTDTQVNGVWQTAQPIVFGSGVQDTPPYADFASIACSSPGNCSAVVPTAIPTGTTTPLS